MILPEQSLETSLYLVRLRIGGLKGTKQGGNASAETADELWKFQAIGSGTVIRMDTVNAHDLRGK